MKVWRVGGGDQKGHITLSLQQDLVILNVHTSTYLLCPHTLYHTVYPGRWTHHPKHTKQQRRLTRFAMM